MISVEVKITYEQARHLAAAVAHRKIDLIERGQDEKWPGERELKELETLDRDLLKPLLDYFRHADCCHHFVQIPAANRTPLNLACAVNVVLYSRLAAAYVRVLT